MQAREYQVHVFQVLQKHSAGQDQTRIRGATGPQHLLGVDLYALVATNSLDEGNPYPWPPDTICFRSLKPCLCTFANPEAFLFGQRRQQSDYGIRKDSKR